MTATSLRSRERQPEIMDQPGLDPARHRRALAGLGRINAISGTARAFWPELEDLSRRTRRPITVLDAACGGGDVAIALGRIARRRGIALEVRGCDLSPTALQVARRRAEQAQIQVEFFELDVVANRLPRCDAVVCSLFLHHLSSENAIRFLRSLSRSAGRLVQVSDLVRSALGHALAWTGCRLLSRSQVVHIDGPRSVRAAFTIPEAAALATRAGLEGARIRRRFPERFHLTWRPA